MMGKMGGAMFLIKLIRRWTWGALLSSLLSLFLVLLGEPIWKMAGIRLIAVVWGIWAILYSLSLSIKCPKCGKSLHMKVWVTKILVFDYPDPFSFKCLNCGATIESNG